MTSQVQKSQSFFWVLNALQEMMLFANAGQCDFFPPFAKNFAWILWHGWVLDQPPNFSRDELVFAMHYAIAKSQKRGDPPRSLSPLFPTIMYGMFNDLEG